MKFLLLAAVLMIAAAPAFAAGPTATLQAQIVPAVAGPPIPVAAQEAGYTTLAFHSDFTQPFYATLSNWLDCAGAGIPQWFATGANGAPAPSCSRYSIVNDGGVQALDMKFTAADAGSAGTSIVTTNDQGARYTRGVDFPNGAYFQATFRVTPASQDGSAVPFGSHIAAWWSWSDTGQTSSAAFWEHDFIETFATGCCHNDTEDHPWFAPGAQFSWGIAGFGPPEYQIDGTVYHKIAERITQDGSTNYSICVYIDDVLQKCGDAVSAGLTGAAAITASQFNQRNYPILVVGPQNSTPVSADMDLLVTDVQIWTCAGWQSPLNTPGHACNGPVLPAPAGSGIACANGQTPFTGVAPSIAANAGFSTCAYNADFSNGFYATQSNWMDCSQTNSSVLWHNFFPSNPCSFSQVTDPSTGDTVLRNQWLTSTGVSGNARISQASMYYDNSHYLSFPNMYVEVTSRLDSASLEPGHSNCCGPDSIYSCQVDAGGNRFAANSLELDYFELFGGASGGTGNQGGAGFGDAGAGFPGCGLSNSQAWSWQSYNTNNLPGGWDMVTYHKYSMLITSNQTTSYVCFFVDDQLMGGSGSATPGCGAFTLGSPAILQRWYLFMDNENNPSSPPTTDQTIYYKYIRVWTCPSWEGNPGDASHMCFGSTLAGNGGLQYYH